MTYHERLRELDQLIADASEVLTRSSIVLQALKEERVNLIIAHAQERGIHVQGRGLPA